MQFLLTVLFLKSSSGMTEYNLSFTDPRADKRGLAQFGAKVLGFFPRVVEELLSISAIIMSLTFVTDTNP